MASGIYDILTVGGGLDGSTLAEAMAEHGAQELVVERETQFKDRVRGEQMSSCGYQIPTAVGPSSGCRLLLHMKEMLPMRETYTAVIKQSGQWWIGWIEEVPGVNCQETTKEELLESLRETLREALEFNRREALEAAGDSFEEATITL